MGLLLHASNLSCSRPGGENRPVRIESVSFQCKPGALHLLLGAPGAGGEAGTEKVGAADSVNSLQAGTGANRLLLRLLALMEKPDSGEVFLHGSPTSHLEIRELAQLRSRHFGFLFPQPFLLPSLSVFENVAMPLFKISGVNVEDARKRTSEALEFVGLTQWEEPIAGDLPAFDQQRVALARALVNTPECLFLEELDESLAKADLMELTHLVRKASKQFGTAAIFSASDPGLAGQMDCVLEINQAATPAAAPTAAPWSQQQPLPEA